METGFILAAGKGTRMKWTTSPSRLNPLAKAVAPIGLRRLMDYSLGALQRAEIKSVWCDLFWLPQTVLDYLKSPSCPSKVAALCNDHLPGTYGSVLFMAKAAQLGEGDTAVVLNCDIVHNLDLRPVIEAHRQSGAAMTMVVNPVWNRTEIARYGTTTLEGMKHTHEFGDYEHYVTYLSNYIRATGGRALRVESFTEKKPWGQTMSLLNDSSIYVVSGRVIRDYHPNRELPSINYDLVPWLLKHPREYPLFGFVMPFEQEGRAIFWRDVASDYDLWRANMDRLRGNIEDPFGIEGRTRARIAKSAKVYRSILGRDVEIGKGAEVVDSVVGNGVVVEEKDIVSQSVLFPESRVGQNSVLLKSMFLGGRIGPGITANRKIIFTADDGEIRIEPLC